MGMKEVNRYCKYLEWFDVTDIALKAGRNRIW